MTDDLTEFTRRLFGRKDDEDDEQPDPATPPRATPADDMRTFTASLFNTTDD